MPRDRDCARAADGCSTAESEWRRIQSFVRDDFVQTAGTTASQVSVRALQGDARSARI
jgi:hypothetical protein